MLQKKTKRGMNKRTRILLIAVGILVILISLVQIINIVLEDQMVKKEQEELLSIINNISSEEDLEDAENEKVIKLTGKTYVELKEINPHFMGWLSFDSGLINQPVVQASDNEYYLNRSFFGKRNSTGTAFIDYAQTLNMQNLTIYGHLVYRNENLMFSPLHKLVDQSNYDANRYFSLSTEDEVRNYQVAIVFYYDIEEDATSIPYYYGDFSPELFEQYIFYAKEKQFYETGVQIGPEDKIITLQTCVKNEDNLRLIVVGKLISVEPIR